MILDREIGHYKSATHNGADTGTTGGAKSATKVQNFSQGEILPRLVAKTSGVVDSADVEKQWQQGHIGNDNAVSTGYNGLFYCANLLRPPTAPGVAKLAGIQGNGSNPAADSGLVKIQLWGINSNTNLVDFEELLYLGTTLVTGAKPWTRLLRARARKVSDGSPAILSGNMAFGHGAGNEQVGIMPVGFGTSTGELKFWLPAATNTSITSTNRRTAPEGWVAQQPNSRANAIPVRNDVNNSAVGPLVYQAYWVCEELQPTMPAWDWVDMVPVLELDSGE